MGISAKASGRPACVPEYYGPTNPTYAPLNSHYIKISFLSHCGYSRAADVVIGRTYKSAAAGLFNTDSQEEGHEQSFIIYI